MKAAGSTRTRPLLPILFWVNFFGKIIEVGIRHPLIDVEDDGIEDFGDGGVATVLFE